MKAFNRVVGLVAAISVTVFLASMAMVIFSDGTHELAAEVCIYSLVLSFITLVAIQPKETSDEVD